VRSTFEHVLLEHKVLPPYVDNVVGQGAARGTIVIEARDTTVDVKGGGIEEPSLRFVSMTLTWWCNGWNDATDPHETLERRPVKGLAVLGGHIAGHGYGFFPLGKLVTVVCGGGGEALGGMDNG
jgi:hypothetical protein